MGERDSERDREREREDLLMTGSLGYSEKMQRYFASKKVLKITTLLPHRSHQDTSHDSLSNDLSFITGEKNNLISCVKTHTIILVTND